MTLCDPARPRGVQSRNGVLSPAAAYATAATSFTFVYFAAGAPTPLLVLYQQQWGFGADMLTIAFAAYTVGLLVAFVTLGALSDHIGRRPVLVGALLTEVLALALFLLAPNIQWIIAGRIIQGLATGAATSAYAAAILELAPPSQKRFGTIIGSIAPTGGLGVGALLTGIAIQFTPAPNTLVMVALISVTMLAALSFWLSPETITRAPGALRSLIPRIAVPSAARAEFIAAVPANIAAWMLAGLFLGLAPTIIHSVMHIDSGVLNGASGFVGPVTAAATAAVFVRLSGGRATVIGLIATVVSGGIITLSVATGEVSLLYIGELVGGVGFGGAFSGSLRSIVPLAAPHQRAAVVAAIYVVTCLSFGIPVILVGQFASTIGLLNSVVGYSAVITFFGIAGLVARARLARREC